MKLIYKKKDIANSIKIYYRKLEGMDVNVIVNNDCSIDDTFKISYSFNQDKGESIEIPISANKVNEILRALLTSYGFTVGVIKTDYGLKNNKDGFVPTFHNIIVECEFTELIKKNKSVR